MGLLRLVVFGFLFLSVIYLAISWYSRSVRRENLEKRWAEKHPEDDPDEDDNPARDSYIKEGMARYQAGIRPKLIALVYVIPTIAIAVILYLINAN